MCRIREHKRHGIGQPHILGGADYHAAGDEAGVLPRVDHLGKPVKGRVRIAAPHGFNEGRNGVIMCVPIPIIHDGHFLNALLGH